MDYHDKVGASILPRSTKWIADENLKQTRTHADPPITNVQSLNSKLISNGFSNEAPPHTERGLETVPAPIERPKTSKGGRTLNRRNSETNTITALSKQTHTGNRSFRVKTEKLNDEPQQTTRSNPEETRNVRPASAWKSSRRTQNQSKDSNESDDVLLDLDLDREIQLFNMEDNQVTSRVSKQARTSRPRIETGVKVQSDSNSQSLPRRNRLTSPDIPRSWQSDVALASVIMNKTSKEVNDTANYGKLEANNDGYYNSDGLGGHNLQTHLTTKNRAIIREAQVSLLQKTNASSSPVKGFELFGARERILGKYGTTSVRSSSVQFSCQYPSIVTSRRDPAGTFNNFSKLKPIGSGNGNTTEQI